MSEIKTKNAKRLRVRIENPPPNCKDHTSLERARRYIRHERAEWVVKDRVMRFAQSGATGGAHARLHLHAVDRPVILDTQINCPYLRWPYQPDRMNRGRVVRSDG